MPSETKALPLLLLGHSTAKEGRFGTAQALAKRLSLKGAITDSLPAEVTLRPTSLAETFSCLHSPANNSILTAKGQRG